MGRLGHSAQPLSSGIRWLTQLSGMAACFLATPSLLSSAGYKGTAEKSEPPESAQKPAAIHKSKQRHREMKGLHTGKQVTRKIPSLINCYFSWAEEEKILSEQIHFTAGSSKYPPASVNEEGPILSQAGRSRRRKEGKISLHSIKTNKWISKWKFCIWNYKYQARTQPQTPMLKLYTNLSNSYSFKAKL